MTRRLALSVIFLCLSLLPGAALGQQWPDTAQELEQQAGEVRAQAQAARQDMAQDQAALQSAVSQLRTDTGRKEAQLEALKQRFDELLAREDQARQDLADREQDLSLIESAVLNTARDTERLYLGSLAAIVSPGRLEDCQALLDSEGMPSFEQIRGLVRGLFQEVLDTGAVAVAQAPFLGPSGDSVVGPVLRMGNNAAFYQADGDMGPLVVMEGGRLSAGGASLSGPARQTVQALLENPGHPAFLCVDLSGGSALRSGDGGGFWAHIRSGGVLVWPILGVGLVGLLLGLERILVLIRVKPSSESTLEKLAGLLRKGSFEESRQLCARFRHTPACRVIGAGLDHKGASKEVLENVFHDAILKEVPPLERFLPTLAVLGAVAPLMGLLGTVTGMINTFSVMTLSGNSDPKLMSGGISEALVTTELGLAVAIPILLLHHFLERRVDSVIADMEEKSVAFSVTLLGDKQPGATS